MEITDLDHFVLTVADIDQTVAFYTTILGLEKRVSPEGRVALHFDNKKINLHVAGDEFTPCARRPTAGSADLCFLVNQSIEKIVDVLCSQKIPVVTGPVPRNGAAGPMTSLYIRDPDGNLVELAALDKL